MTVDSIIDALAIDSCENVFYVGTSKRGITISKQQNRAYNLIYSLQQKNIIIPGVRVAIIGAGISGISASAAALYAGCKVSLFEKKSILLHLQTGCKTRWIHPNIYDWPLNGSEFPYARLPILNWKEGYSSDIVQQFLREYKDITNKAGERYHEYLSAKFTCDVKSRQINMIDCKSEYDRMFLREYDVMIFCTGFGLESGAGINVNSYWRNDDLDQPITGDVFEGKREIVISGSGDGAIIDLLRATLQNFHQGRIIEDMLSTTPKREEILSRLREIKISIEKGAKIDKMSLYRHFDNLFDTNILNPLVDYLITQTRHDTKVTLVGREKFEEILSLEQISILHALLIFLLHRAKKFTYYVGKNISKKTINRRQKEEFLELDSPGIGKVKIKYGLHIQRHGFTESFKKILESFQISGHKFRDENIDTSIRIWSPGWGRDTKTGKILEFVPPMLQAIATTFIETLGTMLTFLHESIHPKFRLTLMRCIEINDRQFLQQVCRYAGATSNTEGENIGRIFDVNYGLIGYSAKIGKPVVLQRESDFEDAIKALNVYPIQKIDNELESMFSVPFYSNSFNGKSYVNAVLFIDSSEKDFFTNKNVKAIIHSCQGFVKNLDNMLLNNEIKEVSGTFFGVEVDRNKEINNFNSLKYLSSLEDEFQYDVRFNTLKSFEIYE